jgi:selenocysteine-specific translation elongation factor
MSVCVTLEDEIDISRGDMLVDAARMPHVSRRFDATLVWMGAEPLDTERTYLAKHTTQQTPARITRIRHRVEVDDLSHRPADRAELNEIVAVTIETTRPLYFDAYSANRGTGAFILIDPIANATLAAGMIEEPAASQARRATADIARVETGRVTAAERIARSRHLPATVWLTARSGVADLVERRLFDRGCLVQALTDNVETHLLPEAARVLNGAGFIAICSEASASTDRAEVGDLLANLVEFAPGDLPPEDSVAAEMIIAELERRAVFLPADFSAGEGI